VSYFNQTIHYDPYRIISISCAWQPHDEIHTDFFPFPFLHCDSSCTGKLGTLFVSVKYVLVGVKLVCLCEAFKNLNVSNKGYFYNYRKTRVVFAKCIWMEVTSK
jgi:hypothetical protein